MYLHINLCHKNMPSKKIGPPYTAVEGINFFNFLEGQFEIYIQKLKNIYGLLLINFQGNRKVVFQDYIIYYIIIVFTMKIWKKPTEPEIKVLNMIQ